MKKSDLKNGMIIVTRKGKIGMILYDCIYGLDWWNSLDFYDESLQAPRWKFESEPEYLRGSETDIVEVYEVKSVGTYLPKLLTKDILERFGTKLQ